MLAKMFRVAWLLVPVLACALIGCSASGPTEKSTGEGDKPAESCPECAKATESEPGCCSVVTEKPKESAEGRVTIQTVKYTQLTEAVRSHRGKVVVLDVWASWCLPCKKEFPNLVALHRTYAPDGLVCISVSVDDTKEKEAAALTFLQKQKATFPNYRLDETWDFWAEKWDLKGIPAVFVFDRDGKRAGKFTMDDPDNQFEYDRDIVPLVRSLLKQGPANK